jgi:hypothetical protein
MNSKKNDCKKGVKMGVRGFEMVIKYHCTWKKSTSELC